MDRFVEPTEPEGLTVISLADLQRRIEANEVSVQAAIAQAQERIAAKDQGIGAFVCHDPSAIAATAGPLRGIAVGIKDIIDTADFPTEMGSPIYRGFRPRADAPVVSMLKRAGATIVGKTSTTAFAATDPTMTLNPHNPGHTPGGSSAGSAASVGAGMIPLTLGTQTGGSVIRPASYCGAAAIKPSFGLLPTVGVKCFSWSLDTVGLFAAGIEDLACGISAITGRPELLLPASIGAPRIGVVTQDFAGGGEKESVDALQLAARAAERSGAGVRTLALPGIFADTWRIHTIVQQFEAHQALAWEYRERYDQMPPLLRSRLDETRDIGPADYDEAREIAARGRAALGPIFQEVDVLLTFSAPGAPPKGLDSTGDPRLNRLWTLLGTPCVNVPTLTVEGNLPVGVQVIAPYGSDARALAAARFVEQALKR